MAAEPSLARRLGLVDAVVIGLGSMIGAGVFAAFAPAAEAAGSWLLVGLLLAGVAAICNATASAQLAARYPTSGGTYVYGREELGHWWGFLAGWCFVIGKTASCAAMALTFATYAVPWPQLQRPTAIVAVVALAAVNYRGVTRTARLAGIILIVVLATLVLAVTLGWTSAPTSAITSLDNSGPWGVLQAGGLLFFAFAGYARIATMGEEVRDPTRTIPRAIVLALAITLVVYGVVAMTLLRSLGPSGLAAASAPVIDAVATSGQHWAIPLIRVGAAAAALGSLLSLIAGVGRTSLAMSRHGDLPRWLSAVHPRFQVPHHAEVAVAVVVSLLVAFTDLRSVIGFSSFGVLLYYAVANAAAFRQRAGRRYWRGLQVLGLMLCLVLSFSLPVHAVLIGAGVIAVGMLGRLVVLARRKAATD